MQDLPDRYSEVISDAVELAQRPALMPGFFGWHQRGHECSVVVDRDLYPNEDSIRRSLGARSVRELRPVSLERWFAARVAGVQTVKVGSVSTAEMVSL